MLEVESLACLKGDRLLFRDLAFRLQAGGLLRVAGPNGVGKTSLLRLVTGLVFRYSATLTGGISTFSSTCTYPFLQVMSLSLTFMLKI